MKKTLMILSLIVLLGFGIKPVLAAKPALTFLNIWVYEDYSKLNWLDDTGKMIVVSGYSPLAGAYTMLAGDKPVKITKMSFKVENAAFVKAIDKLYAITFTITKNKNNQKTIIPKQKELTVAADGTVVASFKNDPIIIPRNSSTTVEVKFLIKNDAGKVPSGQTTTFSLLKNSQNQLIGLDAYVGAQKVTYKNIQNDISSNPAFVLHHAVGKILDACRLLDCNKYASGTDAKIGELYYSAERQVWENKTFIPKPELKSLKISLEGGAIGDGIGDNQIVVTAHSRNHDYSADIVIGQTTLTNADNGHTDEGEITVASQYLLDNGSRAIWFTVNTNDDDFSANGDTANQLTLVATNLSIFDGEVTFTGNPRIVKSTPVILGAPDSANATTVVTSGALQTVNGQQQAVLTATVHSPEQSGTTEILMGNDDSKSQMRVYKTCDGPLTNNTASCVLSFTTVNRHNGFYYARFLSGGVTTESSMSYFNY